MTNEMSLDKQDDEVSIFIHTELFPKLKIEFLSLSTVCLNQIMQPYLNTSKLHESPFMFILLDNVYNSRHLQNACVKALMNQQKQKLKTKTSWHHEVCYCLSSSTKINESITMYSALTSLSLQSSDITGIDKNTLMIAMLTYNDNDIDIIEMDRVNSLIEHDDMTSRISEEEFNNQSMNDITKCDEIHRLYNSTEKERKLYSLESIICTRIGVKDIL